MRTPAMPIAIEGYGLQKPVHKAQQMGLSPFEGYGLQPVRKTQQN
jgi:hypothetical protein